MSTPFFLDKDQLYQAAMDFKQTLLTSRKRFDAEGYRGSVELVDALLSSPALALCIARELEEPYNFNASLGRLVCDDLGSPDLVQSFYRLCDLGRGGISQEDFWHSEYCDRIPRKLRPSPEYVPSAETLKKI